MRLTMVILLALSLAGCITQSSDDASAADGGSSIQSDCVQNGHACRDNTPTGPNETIDIDERIDMTMGADRTFAFSVHNGTSEATLSVHLGGAGETPAGAGNGKPCIDVQGPGFSQKSGRCSGGSISTTVVVEGAANSEPVISLQDLATGDWTIHVSGSSSAMSVVVEASVHY